MEARLIFLAPKVLKEKELPCLIFPLPAVLEEKELPARLIFLDPRASFLQALTRLHLGAVCLRALR